MKSLDQDMLEIMESPEHQAIFAKAGAKPAITKKASASPSAYEVCVKDLLRLSEVLDKYNKGKTAAVVLQSVDTLIREAQESDENDAFTITGLPDQPAGKEVTVDSLLYPEDSQGINFESVMHDGEPEIHRHVEEDSDFDPEVFEDEPVEITEEEEDLPQTLRSASLETISRLLKSAKEKKKLNPKAKVRNRPSPIFPADHAKVKDEKDHFPINTAARARNALARSHQFSEAPEWWKGSLKDLQNAVARAVKKEYPSIDVGGKKE